MHYQIKPYYPVREPRRQGGSAQSSQGEVSPHRVGPAAVNDLRCMPVYEELDNHASIHATVQNVCHCMHVAGKADLCTGLFGRAQVHLYFIDIVGVVEKFPKYVLLCVCLYNIMHLCVYYIYMYIHVYMCTLVCVLHNTCTCTCTCMYLRLED